MFSRYFFLAFLFLFSFSPPASPTSPDDSFPYEAFDIKIKNDSSKVDVSLGNFKDVLIFPRKCSQRPCWKIVSGFVPLDPRYTYPYDDDKNSVGFAVTEDDLMRESLFPCYNE